MIYLPRVLVGLETSQEREMRAPLTGLGPFFMLKFP